PSGDYHGSLFFAPNGDEGGTLDVSLTLEGEAAKGKGTSWDGAFALEGNLDARGLRFQTKPENGAPPTAFLATWDEAKKELSGRWRAVNSSPHGTFKLKLGKRAGAEPPTRAPREIVEEMFAKHQAFCSLDLKAVRFDGEEIMLTSLVADAEFYSAMQAAAATPPDPRREGQMAAFMVRLTPAMLPHAFRALARCIEVVGLKRKVMMYVSNDGSLNAMCSTAEDGTVRVTLTSGLLDALDEAELTYVIGHEIGHATLGHLDVRINDDRQLSGLSVLRHFALRRYQELSADRVGLLCSPDLDRVLRAELMMHSGITRRDLIGEPAEILRAAEDALALAKGDFASSDSRYATHPYGPMRTLAIAHFGKSHAFAELAKAKAPSGALDHAALDKKVQEVMDLMNPMELGATGDVGPDVTRFLALGALQIAAASDGISEEEVTAIKRLAGVEAIFEPLRALSFEEQQIEVAEVAEKLTLELPPAKRLRMLEDLALIASADGSISPEEEQVFYGLANVLQVYPNAPLAALAQTKKALD
ncbi:MAG TPA: M48 family metallopeptidase, partial [bacterium]|nr:M48 family metallopeptidase [bacterium]